MERSNDEVVDTDSRISKKVADAFKYIRQRRIRNDREDATLLTGDATNESRHKRGKRDTASLSSNESVSQKILTFGIHWIVIFHYFVSVAMYIFVNVTTTLRTEKMKFFATTTLSSLITAYVMRSDRYVKTVD